VSLETGRFPTSATLRSGVWHGVQSCSFLTLINLLDMSKEAGKGARRCDAGLGGTHLFTAMHSFSGTTHTLQKQVGGRACW
jgi:hypothetical protein